MWPLIIGGALLGAIISSLTDKKAPDKGENVTEPKAPKNEPSIATGNDVPSDGGGASGFNPQNNSEINDDGAP